MKKKTNKKKLYTIIFTVLCLIIIGLCLIVQQYYKKETENLEKESEILNTLDITTLSGNKITTEYLKFEDSFLLKIPTSFIKMNQNQIKIKYPSGNPPTYVFSNQETTVNVAISMTETPLRDNQVKEYLKTLTKAFSSTYEVIDSSLSQKDNHQIGKISFHSKAIDTGIYNHMMFFSNKGKLTIISFNSTTELEKEWKKVGDFILDSIFFTSDNHE